MTRSILIIAGDWVEDLQLAIPFQTLQTLGFTVHVVAPEREEGSRIKTAVQDYEGDQTYTERRGHDFRINYSIKNVKPETYDALVIPGVRTPEYLRLYDGVLTIVSHFVEMKKPILLICHGVQLLTPIKDSIRGVKITSSYFVEPEVRLAGGVFQRVDMYQNVVDRNFVSTPGWQGLSTAMRRFTEMLGITITTK